MIVLLLLGVIAWNLIPYKTWSRGLLGGEGFNLGDVFLLMVMIIVATEARRWWRRTPLSPWIVALGCVLLLSFFKGVMDGESLREMGRVARGWAFWVIVPLMVLTLHTRERFEQWVRGMGVLVAFAGVTIVAFSFHPALIPPGDEVGVFRSETVGGFERVFTPGMWAVYAGSIFALAALLLRRGQRFPAGILLLLFVVSLSFTFARTFAVGLAIATLFLLLLGKRETPAVLAAAIGLIWFAFLIPGLPVPLARLGDAIAERSLMVFTASPEYTLQTMFWRLAEFGFFTGRMEGVADWTFGVLGRVYTLPEGYTASMPHIAYFGILYGHGIAGSVVYAAFLVVITIRLLRNAARARASELHWAAAGAAAAWLALLAAGLAAPIFAFSWGVAALAFAAGISETVTSLLEPEHEKPALQHHHTLSQRLPVYRGDR